MPITCAILRILAFLYYPEGIRENLRKVFNMNCLPIGAVKAFNCKSAIAKLANASGILAICSIGSSCVSGTSIPNIRAISSLQIRFLAQLQSEMMAISYP